MPVARVRRAPLPLVLLWLNYAAQEDGLETWWLDETAARKDAQAVAAELAQLRAAADETASLWE